MFVSICPLPALRTPFPLKPFNTEEIAVCSNEVTKGAKKAARNPPFCCFFYSCFTVLVTPSINTPESCIYLMILIKSFLTSFEIYKVNPLSVVTSPFSLIVLPSLSITFEVAFESNLLTNQSILYLAIGITRSVITSLPILPKLPNISRRNPLDLIILDNFTLLSFTIPMVFLILVVCFFVRNNS